MREIHYYICIPGFRTKEIIVVTTLIDAVKYPASAILDLYDSRWEAEINLRHIKTTLGMDILSCQTPEMVRKQIYTYLLAYNLLRSVMYEAGTTFDRNPVRLSLQATRQHLDNFSSQWDSKTNKKARKIYRTMLEKVADSYEEKRVGRVEPRVRKRRPKAYPRFARASECSTGKNEICLTSGFRLKLAAFRYKQLPHGFLAGRFISCWTTNTRLYETRFAP